MLLRVPKKNHKERWYEAEKKLRELDPYGVIHPTFHPYHPNNPNNPYARKPTSEKDTHTKQEQRCDEDQPEDSSE